MLSPEESVQILKDAIAQIESGDPSASKPQTVGQWFNHNMLTFILFLVTAGTGAFIVQLDPSKVGEIWSKIANVCIFWAFASLYKLFWRGVSNDQGSFVNTDPRATSIYIGAILVGTALVIALS